MLFARVKPSAADLAVPCSSRSVTDLMRPIGLIGKIGTFGKIQNLSDKRDFKAPARYGFRMVFIYAHTVGSLDTLVTETNSSLNTAIYSSGSTDETASYDFLRYALKAEHLHDLDPSPFGQQHFVMDECP